MKHRIHELEGEVLGYKQMLDLAEEKLKSAHLQEPDHSDELTIAYMSGVHRGKELAAQRQWVGLTDEEIEKACVPLGAAMLSFTEVAHAIEAKLREKNQ